MPDFSKVRHNTGSIIGIWLRHLGEVQARQGLSILCMMRGFPDGFGLAAHH